LLHCSLGLQVYRTSQDSVTSCFAS
jgi:hypothetical protein